MIALDISHIKISRIPKSASTGANMANADAINPNSI